MRFGITRLAGSRLANSIKNTYAFPAFLHTVPVAAFFKAATVLPKVCLQGDPGGHTLMVNSCSVPWMSWSPDMFACGVGILLFDSVKTPFCRETAAGFTLLG